ETVLAAGGLAYVPRGMAHGHRNRADQPARWLTLFAPGGMEGYFAERAVQVAAGTRGAADYAGIDEAEHMALRSRYGIELVRE
ncbi:MAG: cupin domain-containing protein, partial [Candidatus Limnocylindrales bacterium]